MNSKSIRNRFMGMEETVVLGDIVTGIGLMEYDRRAGIGNILVGLGVLIRYRFMGARMGARAEYWLGWLVLLSGIVWEIKRKGRDGRPKQLGTWGMVLVLQVVLINIGGLAWLQKGDATFLHGLLEVLPIVILLLSIIPTNLVTYFRFVYYVLFIGVTWVGIKTGNLSELSILKPAILITFMLIGWHLHLKTSKVVDMKKVE